MVEFTIEYVLGLWIGESSNKITKGQIKENFLQILESVTLETLGKEWRKTPEGRLALILSYDQAPRCSYEDGRAYQFDAKAQELTDIFWNDKSYLQFEPRQQMLSFFPYHHAENWEYQRRALHVFQGLYNQDSHQFEWIYESSENYNQIIERFSRFPHRNISLGRETTEDEWKFLVNEHYGQNDLKDLKERGLLPEKYHNFTI